MDAVQLRRRYQAVGQGHVFHFWPKLTDDQRSALVQQLRDIDIERVHRVYQKAVTAETDALKSAGQEAISPLPVDLCDVTLDPVKVEAWRVLGLEAIANGE